MMRRPRDWARQAGNERFAFDAYRRFIQMFGKIVLDVDPALFEHALEARKEAARARRPTPTSRSTICGSWSTNSKRSSEIRSARTSPPTRTSNSKQAISAVFRSWNGERARAYRENEGIAHDLGTAVNVQAMVFGNMGDDSGTGVAFTRNPSTGRRTPLR